jgi:hypothetical protein
MPEIYTKGRMEKLDKIAENYTIRTEQPRDFKNFLCKELQEGFLDGITGSYRDPEPYFVAMRNPEAFEKYDSEFPPKEKLVLPGQLG